MQILSRGAPKSHSPSTSHHEMKLPQPSLTLFLSLLTIPKHIALLFFLSLSLSLSLKHTQYNRQYTHLSLSLISLQNGTTSWAANSEIRK